MRAEQYSVMASSKSGRADRQRLLKDEQGLAGPRGHPGRQQIRQDRILWIEHPIREDDPMTPVNSDNMFYAIHARNQSIIPSTSRSSKAGGRDCIRCFIIPATGGTSVQLA